MGHRNCAAETISHSWERHTRTPHTFTHADATGNLLSSSVKITSGGRTSFRTTGPLRVQRARQDWAPLQRMNRPSVFDSFNVKSRGVFLSCVSHLLGCRAHDQGSLRASRRSLSDLSVLPRVPACIRWASEMETTERPETRRRRIPDILRTKTEGRYRLERPGNLPRATRQRTAGSHTFLRGPLHNCVQTWLCMCVTCH